MTRKELLQVAKPILFNTDMVRAILDGRKTVTRRIVKLPKWIVKQDDGSYIMFAEGTHYEKQCFEDIATYLNRPCCRSDVLYVRETWCKNPNYEEYYFKTRPYGIAPYNLKWKPSIHMPKEAARIFLRATDVRVERLQEITIEQIHREGVEVECPHVLNGEEKRNGFSQLWNSTIKKADIDLYGWDANPYVWVIEFERIEMEE